MPSAGSTQPLSALISWTIDRARSWLDQKPGSACCASSSLSRAVLAGRSKKLSQLEDAPFQLVHPFDQTRHVPTARG